MKRIIQLTILLSMIAIPFTGYCSYRQDALDSGMELYTDDSNYPKCLLLIDLIKNTNHHAKKVSLKSTLEVELLVLMDTFLYYKEEKESEIEELQNLLDKATTEDRRKQLRNLIAEMEKGIERLMWSYGEVEALFKHTR